LPVVTSSFGCPESQSASPSQIHLASFGFVREHNPPDCAPDKGRNKSQPWFLSTSRTAASCLRTRSPNHFTRAWISGDADHISRVKPAAVRQQCAQENFLPKTSNSAPKSQQFLDLTA